MINSISVSHIARYVSRLRGNRVNLKRVLVMICKGNFNGELVDGNNGAVDQIDAFCVVVCEDDNEWKALREAILYHLLRLKQITRPEPRFWDFSEEIKILQKIFKETE